MPIKPDPDPRRTANLRPHSRRSWCFAFATLILVVCYVTMEWYGYRRVRPPNNAQNLRDFAKIMPTPKRIAVVREGSLDRIVWIAPAWPGPLITSGPPCYVFDDGGRLLNWAPETGDGSTVDSICSQAQRAESISLDDAMRITLDGVR